MNFFARIWPPLPVWKKLDLGVFATVVYSFGVAVLLHWLNLNPPKWLSELGIVNAVLLGVLLGFRNREAYERWWEGRKLWGQLVNDSRNLAVKIKAYVGVEECREVADLLSRFALSLKHHLRQRSSPHEPAAIAGLLFTRLHEWHTAGKVIDYEFLLLDPHARSLMEVCGACERIQSTPVPLSYRSLLRHGTILYLLSAPWFIAGDHGYWGIAIVGLIAYFLLGTELTAESIENPFGHDGDDLELAKYCEAIRDSMRDILGN